MSVVPVASPVVELVLVIVIVAVVVASLVDDKSKGANGVSAAGVAAATAVEVVRS